MKENDFDDEEIVDTGDFATDEQEEEELRYRNFVRLCPNCKKPISEDADSCPFCGDIIFRYLTDGTFAPRKGIWAKMTAAIVLIIVVLGVLMLLWNLVFPG